MPSLPHVSGAEVVRVLEQLGFVVARQRGSHIVLRRGTRGCVVPNHREIKIGTLSGILKQAGLTADEFIRALQSR
ncbi:MAG: type II toxin-antitoxin system HicA family toxin [Gammaproteobacteria bacterium]